MNDAAVIANVQIILMKNIAIYHLPPHRRWYFHYCIIANKFLLSIGERQANVEPYLTTTTYTGSISSSKKMHAQM